MPVYTVLCVDCNKEYEIEKSYSDIMKCPKGHTKRLINKIREPVTIIYNSDGFTKRVNPDE